MTMQPAIGEFTYEPTADWGLLPEGWRMGDVAGVAVDADDQVYVFHRGEHPIIVFDREGNFLRSWGQCVHTRPHALQVTPEDPPITRVAVLSGALLADSLAALHTRKAALPAKKPALPALLVSHGRADPVLPFARGASIEPVLAPYGYPVTFFPFEGGHEIPAALIERLRRFLLARWT